MRAFALWFRRPYRRARVISSPSRQVSNQESAVRTLAHKVRSLRLLASNRAICAEPHKNRVSCGIIYNRHIRERRSWVMPEIETPPSWLTVSDVRPPAVRRRSFLKFAGATILATTAGSLWPRLAQAQGGGVNLGSGDIGILNFAYALEQLEALFYTKVTASFYAGISPGEREILSDIRDHEIAHRRFLKKALGRAGIPDLQFDFSAVNFRSRDSVLQTARTFEDTGVAAYNGAGQLLRDPGYLLAAGRIVSVEARHAATLRDLLAPRSAAFAGDDIVNAFGLGLADRPSSILKAVAPYVVTPINADNLPRRR